MVLFRRTLIIILAIVFCLIIWYVGPIVSVGQYRPFYSVWIRVLLISIVLIIVFWPIAVTLISFLLRYFLKPFKQKPKQKKELDAVTARFQDTISTLKVSSLPSNKNKFEEIIYKITKPYLEDRPWYLVIGAPSVGKTSFLHNSGERFLHSEQYGFGQTVNIGPTHIYNSWISDRAVYFDTSPEWLKLDGQQEESINHVKNFFKLVKKYRVNSGLDGIILCIDAEWLRKAPINELKSFADSLRIRLLEITKTLSQDLPVYLFITKIDLLPGAKEFMYMFDQKVMSHGLGLSAPQIQIDGRDEDYFIEFSKRYDSWLVELTNFLLEILHDSLDDQIRKQLFEFVELIGSLKAPLLNLSKQIFPSYPTGYSGYLHDIWFGSAILLKVSEHDEYDNKYLGQLYLPALTRVVESRGILDNLTATKKIRLSRRKVVKYTAIAVFTIGALFILTTKYFKEVDYISYVAAKFRDTKRIVKEVPLSNKVGDELLYAYAQLDYINSQLYNGGASDRFNFSKDKMNPYVEHIFINDTLNKTYHNHLLKFFWPAVTNYVTDKLASDVKYDSPDVYKTLRIYQMFVKPEHRSSADLINWFMNHWDDFAPSGYTSMDRRTFAFHLKNLFDSKSFQDGPPSFKPNQSLVSMAILKSGNVLMTTRVIDRLKEIPVPANVIDITLAKAGGNNASLMIKHKDDKSMIDVSIPAFYTRGAYQDLFLENLDKVIESVTDELSWVLNDNSSKDLSKLDAMGFRQKLKEDAVQYYLIAFINQWKSFIDNITIRPVKNLEDSAFLAKQLADPSSPIVNFFRFVHRELNLTGTGDNAHGNWLKRTYSDVGQKRKQIIGEISGQRVQYRLSPEKLVEDQFRSLLDIGDKIARTEDLNGNPVSKLFDDVYNLIYPLSLIVKNDPSAANQQESVFGQIKGRAILLPEPLKSILLDLIQNSQSQAIQEIKRSINNKIEGMFTGVCQATIKSKYPFNRRSSEDVSIPDFNRIFAPSGELEQFFKENNIQQLIQQQEYGNNRKGFVDSKIMKTYKDFTSIKNSFFTNNNQIGLTFDVKPLRLSPNVFQADIDIDGQKIMYSHGYPTTTKVTWPGQNKTNTIRIVFQTDNGSIKIRNFTGPWALFKLYDASRVIKSGPNYRVISFVMDGKYSMNLEIKSDMTDFPLWNNAIKSFSCP